MRDFFRDSLQFFIDILPAIAGFGYLLLVERWREKQLRGIKDALELLDLPDKSKRWRDAYAAHQSARWWPHVSVAIVIATAVEFAKA